jgi:RNA polymerase sigma factor (sigma-70 family)
VLSCSVDTAGTSPVPAVSRQCRCGSPGTEVSRLDRATELDDATAVARARTGDLDAYEVLVARYTAPAHRAAVLLGAGGDADDVVQEALVKAYRQISRYRGESGFRPWLLAIVANETRNLHRSRRRRDGLVLRAVAREGPEATGPADSAVAVERRRQLTDQLRLLDPRDREVLVCRFLLDLSKAETLGLPKGHGQIADGPSSGQAAGPPRRRGGVRCLNPTTISPPSCAPSPPGWTCRNRPTSASRSGRAWPARSGDGPVPGGGSPPRWPRSWARSPRSRRPARRWSRRSAGFCGWPGSRYAVTSRPARCRRAPARCRRRPSPAWTRPAGSPRFAVRAPSALGPPERVLLADRDDTGAPRVVTLIYRGGAVRLDELDGAVSLGFLKSAPDARWVSIGSGGGVWLPGPHPVMYVGRDGVERTETARLAGPTLIWSSGAVTYRLEGMRTLDEARAAALTLQ